MRTELITAVDYARNARASSPFVGIASAKGTIMLLRSRLKATLKGLRIVDAEIGPYSSNGNAQSYPWKCDKALVIHAVSLDGRVRAKRAFIPETCWKTSPLLGAWQRENLRKMGRCDCWPFRQNGDCVHVEKRRQPKPTKYEAAIRKLEKRIPREWRPENPVVVETQAATAATRRNWHEWKLQKAARRKVMALALRAGYKHPHRAQVKADLTSAKLYVEVAKLTAPCLETTNQQEILDALNSGRPTTEWPKPIYALTVEPLKIKKWGELNTKEREMAGGDLFGYLERLWQFCGLASKPYRDHYEPNWGRERYHRWLVDLHERKEVLGMIAAIRAESPLEASVDVPCG